MNSLQNSLSVILYFLICPLSQIPYKICPRRAGDIASGYADPKLAEQEMGWKATRGIDDMCKYWY